MHKYNARLHDKVICDSFPIITYIICTPHRNQKQLSLSFITLLRSRQYNDVCQFWLPLIWNYFLSYQTRSVLRQICPETSNTYCLNRPLMIILGISPAILSTHTPNLSHELIKHVVARLQQHKHTAHHPTPPSLQLHFNIAFKTKNIYTYISSHSSTLNKV